MQVTALAVTDDEQVISASADGTLRLWSLDGEEQRCFRFDAPVSSCCYHRHTILVGLEDGSRP